MNTYFKEIFLKDFLSSMVVFLVALPLCLGIAIASGVPPIYGLISGVIGGLVVGSFTGSPLQVSGPAAGLVVMVFEIVDQEGLVALGIIGIFAGIFQVLGSIFKIGNYFKAVSPAVVKGMLSGIGVLILASQFHVMLDHAPNSSGIENIATMFQAFLDIFDLSNGVQHVEAATIGLITLVVLVGWNLLKKKIKLPIPAPLIAIITATSIAQLDQLPINYINIPEDFLADINIDFLKIFTSFKISYLLSGLAIALVATTETLLCVSAVDSIVPSHNSDYNKELRAQGIGNILAGLVGALPITGVIVRSSANIEFGGKTKAATIIHGFWLVLFMIFLGDVLRMIPTSALAAILVYTGYKLIDARVTKEFYQFDRTEALIYLGTIAAIVSINLLYGVMIGYALSLLQQVYRLNQFDFDEKDTNASTVLKAHGVMTFLSIPKFSSEVSKRIATKEKITLDMSEIRYMDNAAKEYIDSLKEQSHKIEIVYNS